MASLHSYPQHQRYATTRHHHAAFPHRPSDSYTPQQYSSARRDGYSYDYEPRYSYPPPPPSEPLRSASYHHPPRPKRRWPPQPSVESEKASLSREFGAQIPGGDGGEACMRGAVDQEPIMLEVERERPNQSEERRFVLLGGKHRDNKEPQAREVGKKNGRERERSRGPPLKTKDLDDPPFIGRRQPSPYAFTRNASEATPKKSNGESLLTPDAAIPSSTSRMVPSRAYSFGSTPSGSSFRRERREDTRSSDTTKKSRDSTAKSDVFDSSDVEGDDATRSRSRRRPTRYSFTRADLQDTRMTADDKKVAPRDDRTSRGYSETSSEPSSTAHKHLKPSDVNVRSAEERGREHRGSSTARSDRYEYTSTASMSGKTNAASDYVGVKSKSSGSRPSSPLVNEYALHSSPPRSPRLKVKVDESPSPPKNRSRASSRNNNSSPARTATFPATNQSSLLDNADYDRYATYPPPLGDRARAPYRVSSSSRHNLAPSGPRIDVHSPSPNVVNRAPLPYPDDDDNIMMPSEQQYQVPAPNLSLDTDIPRSPSVASNRSYIPPRVSSPVRPDLNPRHSSADLTTREKPSPKRSPTSDRVDRGPPVVPKKLPPCPRTEYTTEHNDWYTLDGPSPFDICPSCLAGIIGDSRVRRYFRRAPRSAAGIRRRCDFSSHWMRLAWLLTTQQRRDDVDLIYTLADIAAIESECPGEEEVPGKWFTIADERGGQIRNLYACPRDKAFLEAILPSLKGVFARVPLGEAGGGMRDYHRNSQEPHLCSFRAQSARLPAYLDTLIAIDAEAQAQAQSSGEHTAPLPPPPRRLLAYNNSSSSSSSSTTRT